MTTKEIIQVLRANIDKTVSVSYQDGDTDLALVLTVDDEGFVFNLSSLRPEDRDTEYWVRFSDLVEVRPVISSESSK
jgi:hypothetical protein